jgi:hypothetical protein
MTKRNEVPSPLYAIKFLTAFFEADDPWHLYAIAPDRKTGEKRPPPICTTFVNNSRRGELVSEWINVHNVDRNIYFAPSLIDVENKRAKKINVTETRYLWTDLDPLDDHDQTALLRSLADDRPDGIPKATWIVDSGRGAWGFWKLKKSRLMNDAMAIARIEAHNRGIAKAFGGKAKGADGCHNVDRIARLPGTINHKSGRQARVVEHNVVAYKLARFPKADEAKPSDAKPLKIPVGLSSGLDVDDLDLSTVRNADRVVETIKTGCYEGHRWKKENGQVDRSRAMFSVCRSLLKGGIDAGVVAAIMLDPKYKISEHAYPSQ